MRVALVHDWLTGMRGGERCLEAFIRLYPDADIFTLVHIPGTTSPSIDARVKESSFLNRIPGIRSLYKACLPLYPFAVRSFDLRGYDLIISLSHAAAKNVRVPPGVPHLCYCFTPMRYIWDQASSYLPKPLFLLAWPLIQALRWWDQRGSRSVTSFVAISGFVSARIRRYYARSSIVIAPPVRCESEVEDALSPTERAFFDEHQEPFFLSAGALVPYKKIDVAVAAFNASGLPLWIVGGGPELAKLRSIAKTNIRFLGKVSDAFLWECYRRCRALVFPGIEDFGIVPVECLAAGRPVIGIDAGGLKDTIDGVRPGRDADLVPSRHSGVFIPRERCGEPAALEEAVRYFCAIEERFNPDTLKTRAAGFSYARFFREWEEFVRQSGIPALQSSARAAVSLQQAKVGTGRC